MLGLVGESGSGKTTIGRAIAGLTKVSGGSLTVLGAEMHGIHERTSARCGAGSASCSRTRRRASTRCSRSRECVAEPLVVHGLAADAADARGAGRRAARGRAAADARSASASRTSSRGGQRQRASLARAIALDPELLIADEPTSALDVSVQARVLDLFDELHRELGFAALFISHDLAVVDMLADRIAVLHQGKLVEEGTGDEVLGSPQHPYTQRLLASLPVPDPVEQAARREQWEALRAAD